jgi:hypothetical protein
MKSCTSVIKPVWIAGLLAMGLPAVGSAASIIMESGYIRTAISDNGTLGFGSTTSPGLQHDSTGTGSFGVEDYLTPGTPWEWFGVTTSQTGNVGNNNTGTNSIGTTSGGPVDISGGSAFDHHLYWEGQYSTSFTIRHDYFFNNDNERINIETTITALTGLTGGKFLRAIDPDPDVNSFGTYVTINSRGATGVAPEDFVNSQGANTGLTLGLFSNSDVTHNTGVSSPWTTNPDFYLGGGDDGNGDYAIGLAFDFGDLLEGDSITLTYAYVMGGTLDTVDLPDDNGDPTPVPAPATLWLMGIGLLAAAARHRRKA